MAKKLTCKDCSATFNDPRGLGLHRSRVHGVPGKSAGAVKYRADKNGTNPSPIIDPIDVAAADRHPVWHGWIVVEKEPPFRDHFHCEVNGARLATFRTPSAAVDFWDKRAGEPVNLQPTPIGAYRVYTGNAEKITLKDTE